MTAFRLQYTGWSMALRVGPLQYQVRCMVSDQPSMKLPVPHLGHDDMIVFESDVIK